MVDIAKCEGKDEKGQECKKKQNCYRYLAPADEYGQSYFMIEDVENCNEYWEVKIKGDK